MQGAWLLCCGECCCVLRFRACKVVEWLRLHARGPSDMLHSRAVNGQGPVPVYQTAHDPHSAALLFCVCVQLVAPPGQHVSGTVELLSLSPCRQLTCLEVLTSSRLYVPFTLKTVSLATLAWPNLAALRLSLAGVWCMCVCVQCSVDMQSSASTGVRHSWLGGVALFVLAVSSRGLRAS